MPRKALFLDRDGVINVDTGYAHQPEQIVFIDGIFDFCRKAVALDYLLIVVTNQSGVARGMFSKNEVHDLMRWMQERFVKEQCPWTAYYFCPHHPDIGNPRYKRDCDCRKPKPGMIAQAAKDWNIDLASSILIGDSERDIEAAKAAGVGKWVLFDGVFPVVE